MSDGSIVIGTPNPDHMYEGVPEECKLVAHHAGDGWSLAVESEGDVICYLAWPKRWPETISGEELIEFGFEVV